MEEVKVVVRGRWVVVDDKPYVGEYARAFGLRRVRVSPHACWVGRLDDDGLDLLLEMLSEAGKLWRFEVRVIRIKRSESGG
jgi:hypothetical protein